MPYLADHRIQDTVVFPASGYLEMAAQAVHRPRAPGRAPPRRPRHRRTPSPGADRHRQAGPAHPSGPARHPPHPPSGAPPPGEPPAPPHRPERPWLPPHRQTRHRHRRSTAPPPGPPGAWATKSSWASPAARASCCS
ncbi:hypothetical protein AB0G92_31205 [Streptomyces californicus]